MNEHDVQRHARSVAYVDDKPSPDFIQWCKARGVDPDEYRWTTLQPLRSAGADRRGRQLLSDALESPDRNVVNAALAAIMDLRDDSFLSRIELALARFPRDAEEMAMWLAGFRSDAADQVAMKFLPAEAQEAYREMRRMAECETMDLCDP